jgi:IS1 family transposase
MNLNAAARVFGVSKNTIMDWERKFSLLHKVLFIYALTHTFLKMLIEGDELYTKTGKNVSPEQSQGWTIVLMDRASRFIWELRCGKKDRKLFYKVIRRLKKVIGQSGTTCLFTDGERSYGKILFEICNEVIHTGKQGRPAKTLKSGVIVMVKNKGSQSRKRGRKRPKYQCPCPKHPCTTQEIENNEIHANHVEAFNASLRRKISTFRRKTNTYPKDKTGLQRVLDMYWVIYNFVRPHFTIKMTPATAIGIMNGELSMDQLFKIRLF